MEVRTEVIYPTPPRRWRCPIVRPSLLASLLDPTQVQSRSQPSVLAAMHATFNSGMSPTQSPYRLGPAGCVRRPLPHPETRRHRVRAAAAPRQPRNRALGRPYLPLKLCAHLRWQRGSLNPWRIDARLYAKTDLYHQRSSYSTFRAIQGWLSLCEYDPGEGTLRLLPDMKLSKAYILLRPFFADGERLNTS